MVSFYFVGKQDGSILLLFYESKKVHVNFSKKNRKFEITFNFMVDMARGVHKEGAVASIEQ